MTIPIRNLYYLLLYAWDLLETRDLVDVSTLDLPHAKSLLAHLLGLASQKLLARGLDRTYSSHQELVSGVRGRLLLGPTLKQATLAHARTHCETDDLTHNNVHNRIIKSTLLRLARDHELPPKTRRVLQIPLRKLHHISVMPVTSQAFRQVQLHRNNAYYRLAMSICELLHDGTGLSQQTGSTRFLDFTRDPHRMRRVFERFVLNFYRRHTDDHVHAPRFPWQDVTGSPAALTMLPEMRTDIVLENADRVLLIDTKFSKSVFSQGPYGQPKLKTPHLYQLFTYLQNMRVRKPDDRTVTGMLLYPMTNADVDLKYRVQGFALRIATINLTTPWLQIHERLLHLSQAPTTYGMPQVDPHSVPSVPIA